MRSGDADRCTGSATVKYFHPDISPFVGFEGNPEEGFKELFDHLPAERTLLYATRKPIALPERWQLKLYLEGLQFLFQPGTPVEKPSHELVLLDSKHVEEMVQLARLTKPGPFDKRTIEFGHYYGVFENGRLAAMTGQRLHPYQYSEISAVCTHPDFAGRGYARSLFNFQTQLILDQGQIPFLHVRADNKRAIELYEKNGFVKNGPMHFYFMKKE